MIDLPWLQTHIHTHTLLCKCPHIHARACTHTHKHTLLRQIVVLERTADSFPFLE